MHSLPAYLLVFQRKLEFLRFLFVFFISFFKITSVTNSCLDNKFYVSPFSFVKKMGLVFISHLYVLFALMKYYILSWWRWAGVEDFV